MTVGPVELVVAVLEAAGYERLEQPRPVGGIPFEFDAMLAGHDSLDLIVVLDLATERDDEGIRRRIEALARALDLVRSRRSLTVVLAGPRRGPSLIQAIASVARVLSVGTPNEDDDLSDALAVLLPLVIAPEDPNSVNVWLEARRNLLDTHRAEVEPLLQAASRGEGAVESALAELLQEPFDSLWGQEEPGQ